ncbi:MAG: transcriptional regulator [Bacteroidales bacterium 36-12]|nr:MAG: transcriptional regulator [Bacteroidales bacterium 36-12]
MTTTNKDKLHSTSKMLDKKYGERGTETREDFQKKAIAFYYGEMLKDRRKELRITQETLAGKVGLKRSYIARIESGETDMQISSFIRIAEALGMKFSLSV